ncbi:elongation factor P 5-aminopentanone reductase [Clostridium neuense]|uniref:Elongation factor P 5-aminopentanone reductase n=1 Tax=Clostridium neuense TaxID=1728934 RepID=A0ABW8TI08_9CLOT
MYEDLKGKIALVTGASRGIGRSIAVELSKHGVIVIINYKEDKKGAEETLNEVKEKGGSGSIFKCDISINSEVKNMIEDIIKGFGKIDILVNNSGISKIGLFMDMTEKDYDEIMNVNFKGVYNCTSYVVKDMLERKSGSIINISSIWGSVGASCEVLYSASKGAIDSFTKALGKELALSGIRVNAISPGVIDTRMNKVFSEEEREELKNEIPMMRFGKTEEIAKSVVFLVSSEASYITSQVLTVDGGFL